MTPTQLLLASLFLIFTGAGSAAQGKLAAPPAVVPHGEFAAEFLEQHGLAGAEPEDVDLEALIDAEFARLDLGLYEIRFPFEDLAEEQSAEHLKEIALALLRSQELFAQWVEAEDDRSAQSDLRTLRGWIEDWRPRRLETVAAEKPADLARGLDAGEDELAALERFAAWMRTGQPVALERDEPVASRILFMPTRPRFLKFICFAGWYYPFLQEVFWDEGLGTWLGCRVQKTQVIALQFASPDISKADFELGLPLNYKHPTVMQQHAVHFGTQALLDNYYGDTVPGFLSTGLAMNLVLEQFGELDTRIEGDLRARFTDSFSVFVPGGASGGGSLPPYNPDGRWRQEKGKGHFVKLLRNCQKQGGDHVRNSREKGLKFEIVEDDERERIAVTAPFLGSAAENKELPEPRFLGDYQEFFRAYKSAFAWWLQTQAAGSRRRSTQTFARVLRQLGKSPGVEFEGLVQELYGAPLSGERPDKDTLEGRFLNWLAKQ